MAVAWHRNCPLGGVPGRLRVLAKGLSPGIRNLVQRWYLRFLLKNEQTEEWVLVEELAECGVG